MAQSDISPGSTVPASDSRLASRLREALTSVPKLAGTAGIRHGQATLAAGVTAAPISAPGLSATSSIMVTVRTPVPGAGTLTINYAALTAGRVLGAAGTFLITALVAAGTINVADTSTVDWVVVL